MQIIERELSDLKPYENNPRNNDKAVEPVAESIKKFGFKVPIIIDKNNVIICGHTRYRAAKRLKLKTVPCILADDLTDEQVRAFRLADNKVSEFSFWNDELVALEINRLSDIDMVDMEVFGFEKNDLEPINDFEHESTTANEHKLKCDKVETLLTDDEYADFLAAYNDYVEKVGCGFGFIRSLLNG